MSKLLIGVGTTIVVFAVVILGYNFSQEPYTGPVVTDQPESQIYFEPRMLQMGTQYWGGEGEIFLQLYNGGTTTIILDAIETSCDCTGHELPEEVELRRLAPGEMYPLPLTVSMGAEVGPKEIVINAITLDGQRAQAEIVAEVIPTWDLQHEGEFWDFGTYQIGGTEDRLASWAFMYSSQTDKLLDVVVDQEWMTVERRPLPGNAEEILIGFQPVGMVPGQLSGWVTFKMDSTLVPATHRAVRLSVVRALLPSPDPAVLDVGEDGVFHFMDTVGIAAEIVEATAPEGSGLELSVEDGTVRVKRIAAAADEQPIRIDVTASDGRTGWGEVVVPDAIELILPD